MQRSYPSPTAGGAPDGAAAFYNSSSSQPTAVPNPDELQLTAQLSRGLATPTMTQGPGVTNMGDNQVPGAQSLGQSNHQYAQEQTPQPHPAHGRPSQSPMDQMGSPYATPDGSMAPRKRSKASRACDECRRKKIKCDATSETGEEQCSNCRRVGTRCQFSRVPMKRGPSKGYIKELADRLNTLEGAVRTGEMGSGYSGLRRASDEFSPPPSADNLLRKRTFSSAELGSPYQPQSAKAASGSSWTPQETQRHLPHPSSSFQSNPTVNFRDPIYSPNGFPSIPTWKAAASDAPRLQSSAFENVGPESTSSETNNLAGRQPQYDVAVISGYYKSIHPTYPLLPHDTTKLDEMLNNSGAVALEAFFESLHAVVHSFPDANIPADYASNTRKAAQLVSASQINNSASRSWSTNGLYLLSMIFLAIEAENSAPATNNGHISTSKSYWLSSAIDLAKAMELHSKSAPSNERPNPDSEYSLGRRAWLSLVVLDIWNSASMSTPRMIPDSAISLQSHDLDAMREEPYHVARLAIVLGHTTAVRQDPGRHPLCFPYDNLYGLVLHGERERIREGLPKEFYDSSHAPIFRMCYHYVGIMNELGHADPNPFQLLNTATYLVEHIAQHSAVKSLLTHHVTTLAALALLELRQIACTAQQAELQLNILLQTPIPSNWDHLIKGYITKKMQLSSRAVPLTDTELKATAETWEAGSGLQRLADVATAGDGGDGSKKDAPLFARYHRLRGIVNSGYMKVFDSEVVR